MQPGRGGHHWRLVRFAGAIAVFAGLVIGISACGGGGSDSGSDDDQVLSRESAADSTLFSDVFSGLESGVTNTIGAEPVTWTITALGINGSDPNYTSQLTAIDNELNTISGQLTDITSELDTLDSDVKDLTCSSLESDTTSYTDSIGSLWSTYTSYMTEASDIASGSSSNSPALKDLLQWAANVSNTNVTYNGATLDSSSKDSLVDLTDAIEQELEQDSLLSSCLGTLSTPDKSTLGNDLDYYEQVAYPYWSYYYALELQALSMIGDAYHLLAWAAAGEPSSNSSADDVCSSAEASSNPTENDPKTWCSNAGDAVTGAYKALEAQLEDVGAPYGTDSLKLYIDSSGNGYLIPISLEDFTTGADSSCNTPLTSNDPCGVTAGPGYKFASGMTSSNWDGTSLNNASLSDSQYTDYPQISDGNQNVSSYGGGTVDISLGDMSVQATGEKWSQSDWEAMDADTWDDLINGYESDTSYGNDLAQWMEDESSWGFATDSHGTTEDASGIPVDSSDEFAFENMDNKIIMTGTEMEGNDGEVPGGPTGWASNGDHPIDATCFVDTAISRSDSSQPFCDTAKLDTSSGEGDSANFNALIEKNNEWEPSDSGGAECEWYIEEPWLDNYSTTVSGTKTNYWYDTDYIENHTGSWNVNCQEASTSYVGGAYAAASPQAKASPAYRAFCVNNTSSVFVFYPGFNPTPGWMSEGYFGPMLIDGTTLSSGNPGGSSSNADSYTACRNAETGDNFQYHWPAINVQNLSCEDNDGNFVGYSKSDPGYNSAGVLSLCGQPLDDWISQVLPAPSSDSS